MNDVDRRGISGHRHRGCTVPHEYPVVAPGMDGADGQARHQAEQGAGQNFLFERGIVQRMVRRPGLAPMIRSLRSVLDLAS